MRKVLLKLHLWVGLAAALLLLIIALSGTLLVFEIEIDRVLNPRLFYVQPQAQRLSPDELRDRVRKAYPGRIQATWFVPPREDLSYQVIVISGKSAEFVHVNGYTGEILGARSKDKSFAGLLHKFHTSLLWGKTGSKIVGYSTIVYVFLILTGIILWWSRKLWALRWDVSFQRFNFDLHNITGIYTCVFALLLSLTGILLSFPDLVTWIYKRTGDPRPSAARYGSTVRKDLPPLSAEQALAKAQAALPGAEITGYVFPAGAKAAYMILMRHPEDRSPVGRSAVWLDQFTGEVLAAQNSRTMPPTTRFVNNLRPLHTGDIFGWPFRIMLAVSSFTVVIQAVTGFLIWFRRWRK